MGPAKKEGIITPFRSASLIAVHERKADVGDSSDAMKFVGAALGTMWYKRIQYIVGQAYNVPEFMHDCDY